MARYFKNYTEVEYCLGYTFTPEQRELVSIYLYTGIRPEPNGCWTCTAGYIRKITGEIDRFEKAVAAGEIEWPWPTELTYHDDLERNALA